MARGRTRGWRILYGVAERCSAAPTDRQPGELDNDPNRKKTITQSFTLLGMRKADTFGAGYERMGVEVATHICNTHDSIEQYVKLNFSYLDQGGPGQKAQLRELVRSAQTVDIMVQRVAATGGSQKDLAEDDVFEMHMSTICLLYTSPSPRDRG